MTRSTCVSTHSAGGGRVRRHATTGSRSSDRGSSRAVLDLLCRRPAAPAGSVADAGDARQDRESHDLATGRINGADLAQPLERRAGHGPGVDHPEWITTLARVRARGDGKGVRLPETASDFPYQTDQKELNLIAFRFLSRGSIRLSMPSRKILNTKSGRSPADLRQKVEALPAPPPGWDLSVDGASF
jgi:hypothetical protein